MALLPSYPDLSDQERALLEMVREFVDREAKPASAAYEERSEDPKAVYTRLAELGLTGIPFDPEYGGGGEPYRTYLLVVEEIARGWLSLAIGLGVHTLACDGLQRFGRDTLKKELLPALLAGERFGAYALSEPSSGSDAAALTTKAEKKDGHFRISGRKQFCTRGGEADHLLLMARTGGPGAGGVSAFFVDRDTPGYNAGKVESKMGWKASPTWELVFEDCDVPEERLLGDEGQGFKIALTALDSGRLGIAACAIGVARAALESAVKFATEREQFDKPVIEFQGLQFMLADMATQIEAGRALYRHAAALKDAGMAYTKEAAMAKLFCSDTAMSVTTDAVQVHGGYGYIEEYPVERYMREAKALQIVEGTNQIQRMIIGRSLSDKA